MGRILFTPHRDVAPPYFPVKYGLLYNYWAATDIRKITSSDTWVVPTLSHQTTLRTYLGGSTVAGGKMKEIGTTHWFAPNTGATNEVGFNGRGAGVRNTGGAFGRFPNELWIIASDYTFGGGLLAYNNIQFTQSSIGAANKWGFSLRLMRPATASEQLLADGTPCDNYVGNDGKIYRTVKIGTQVWIADNLAETMFRTGATIPFAGANGINFTNAEWAALTTAGCCPYNNDPTNI